MPVVSPTDRDPNYHVSLTDGATIVNMVLYNGSNERDETAFKRYPTEPTALKTYQGEAEYSDQEFPFTTVAQADFSGGRGMSIFEKDRSRYADGYNMNTTHPEYACLAGEVHWAEGYKDQNVFWNDVDVVFLPMVPTGSNAGLRWAVQFTAPATYTAKTLMVPMRKIGSPDINSSFSIVNDNTGAPTGSTVTSATLASVKGDNDGELSFVAWMVFTGALTSGNKYWIVFNSDADDDASNHWEIGTAPGTHSALVAKYTTAAGWVYNTDGVDKFLYHISERLSPFIAKFFEYKGQLYFFTHDLTGLTGKLYMNGTRGVADSNSGNLNNLYDATKNFTSGSLGYDCTGLPIMLTAGTGSNEHVPWRLITTPANGYVTVQEYFSLGYSDYWKVVHDTSTEYVILGSDYFSEITNPTGYSLTNIGDVVPVNDQVIFGSSAGLFAYRGLNASGVWTDNTAACWKRLSDIQDIRFLTVTNDYSVGKVMWVGRNPTTSNEYRALVLRDTPPINWGDNTFLVGGVIHQCDTAWDEYVATNITVTVPDKRMKIAIADAFTTGLAATDNITSMDLTFANKVTLRVEPTVDVAASAVSLLLDDTASCASPLLTLNLPALKKNTINEVTLTFDTTGIDVDTIISVGFQINTDLGAWDMYIHEAISWFVDAEPIPVGKPAENITGMINYDDPERCYVFTESEVGFISNDRYVPIPLREMAALKSHVNGQAKTVGGVYLYFGMGLDGRVERYFRQTLDDIGPTRDDGLPDNTTRAYSRVGYISCLVSYPGDRLFAAVNGHYGYSCIMEYANGGWHELYRAPRGGLEINSLYIQSLPHLNYQKLWFSMYPDTIAWIPIALNPAKVANFPYTYEGALETGWQYGGMRDIQKTWYSVKLFTENLQAASEDDTIIKVEYKTDDDTSWTSIGTYDTSPVDENDIGSSPPGTSGKRIKFRIRFITENYLRSPKLISAAVDGFTVVPVKHKYTFTTKISEGDLSIDLEGDEVKSLGFAANAQTALAQLDSWANALTPLTLNAVFSPFDGKSVILDAIPVQPMRIIPDDQVEEHFLQLSVSELS